jgi:hypothetical protein
MFFAEEIFFLENKFLVLLSESKGKSFFCKSAKEMRGFIVLFSSFRFFR